MLLGVLVREFDFNQLALREKEPMSADLQPLPGPALDINPAVVSPDSVAIFRIMAHFCGKPGAAE
jgi:hypothetical protein